MRIIDQADATSTPFDGYGSRAFSVTALAELSAAQLTYLRLDPGGVIGRHPARGEQWFVLLQGDARVSGEDGSWVELAPGQVAVWSAGESHEAQSAGGMLALAIEQARG